MTHDSLESLIPYDGIPRRRNPSLGEQVTPWMGAYLYDRVNDVIRIAICVTIVTYRNMRNTSLSGKKICRKVSVKELRKISVGKELRGTAK